MVSALGDNVFVLKILQFTSQMAMETATIVTTILSIMADRSIAERAGHSMGQPLESFLMMKPGNEICRRGRHDLELRKLVPQCYLTAWLNRLDSVRLVVLGIVTIAYRVKRQFTRLV